MGSRLQVVHTFYFIYFLFYESKRKKEWILWIESEKFQIAEEKMAGILL